MIVKQQAKRKQSSLCLHAVAKYEKVENINTQNDYETMSKKWADKKKVDLHFVFFKCLNSKKTSQTSGMWTAVCTCSHMHQMEMTGMSVFLSGKWLTFCLEYIH